MTRLSRTMLLPAVLLSALALSACNRSEDQTVGQKVDEAVAGAERQADEARAGAERALDAARQDASEAAADVKQGASELADRAANAVSDATITASINAELAKDASLSALKINVDTVNGHVALKGTAPDEGARDRATQLAAGVEGVSSVDNQLTVE